MHINRILVVDDDALILTAISKTLHTCSCHEVKTVSNGKDALNEMSSSFYPLCFLDVSLPDMNGFHVMKKLKEISPETKVVIMTGNVVDDEMKREIEEGSFDFLAKPFDISEVKKIARLAFSEEGNRATRENRPSERRPLCGVINYSVCLLESGRVTNLNLKGDIVDISDSGMGIQTDFPLEPGHLLTFISGIDYKAGVVKWSRMIADDYLYRIGIEFIEA